MALKYISFKLRRMRPLTHSVISTSAGTLWTRAGKISSFPATGGSTGRSTEGSTEGFTEGSTDGSSAPTGSDSTVSVNIGTNVVIPGSKDIQPVLVIIKGRQRDNQGKSHH